MNSTRTHGRRRLFIAFVFFVFVLIGNVRAGIRLRGDATKQVLAEGVTRGILSRVGESGGESTLLLRKDSSAPLYQVLAAASSSVKPPQIFSQPEDVAVAGPGDVTLSVDAYSAGAALSYLWFKDGVSTGVKTATLTVSVLSNSGLGSYRCKVSNSKYAVYTRTAVVSWRGVSAPVITRQPVGGAKPIGSVVSLSVSASGTDLSYQWRKGGVAIVGATEPLLRVPVNEASAKYDCEVSAGGFAKTASAVATVSSLASSFVGVEPANVDLNVNRGAMLQLALTKSGVVSGKVVSIAGTATFKGALQVVNGKAVIEGATPRGEVLQLLVSDDGETLSGTVAKGGTSIGVEMKRCSWTDPGASLASFAGVYNVALEPLGGTDSQPQGSGWSTVSVSKTGGVVTVSGSLSDGTPISLSSSLARTGEIPLFCPLYAGKGSLVGTLSVQTGSPAPSGNVAEGEMSWAKGSGVPVKAGQAGSYPAGFETLNLRVSGGYYPAPKTGVMFLAAGTSIGGAANVRVTFKESTLSVDIATDFILSGTGTTSAANFVSNPASIQFGTINLKTGLVRGTLAVHGQVAGLVKASTFSGLAIPQGGGLVAKGYVLVPNADAVTGKVNPSERVSGTMEMTALGR